MLFLTFIIGMNQITIACGITDFSGVRRILAESSIVRSSGSNIPFSLGLPKCVLQCVMNRLILPQDSEYILKQ